MEEDLTYTLTAADGSDIVCEFLDLMTYEDKEYIVLLPEGDDEVFILEVKSTKKGSEEEYIPVEDDALIDTLFELFMKRNPEHTFTEE